MKEERIEFIDENKEQRESKRSSLKDFINGSLLKSETIVKQLPFIIFLTFLALIYIANRYHAEKKLRNVINLQKEVKELRVEMITTESKLMYLSKQSEVVKLVEKKGLELNEAVEPPTKIIADKED